MAAKEEMKDLLIPKENADFIIKRLMPFVDKYYQDELLRFKIDNQFRLFDLKALCISCYTQGLQDGVELTNKTE